MLRPKLAYISARQQDRDARVVTEFITELIKDSKTEPHKRSLTTIVEAMVAYHKFHHPKKS